MNMLGQEALPELLEALRTGDNELKRMVIGIYWHIGPPARDALPALAKMRQEPEWKEHRPLILMAQASIRGDIPTGGVSRVTIDLLPREAKLIEKSNDRDLRLCLLNCWPRSKPQPGWPGFPPETLAPIRRGARSDPDVEVRQAAAKMLEDVTLGSPTPSS
jgi:hypothetical protein